MKLTIRNDDLIDGWELFRDESNYKKTYIKHEIYGIIYNRNPDFNKRLADAESEPQMIKIKDRKKTVKISGWFSL